jgi:hypothetical protein
MRRSLIIAATAVTLLAPGFALACTGIGKGAPALAFGGSAQVETGSVTAIDPAAMTFSCHWKSSDRTYQVNAQTMFRKSGAKVRFADLKPKDVVKVKFHTSGKTEVADEVTVEPPGWDE